MAGVEYQVTKVDPTDPETKGMVYQVHKVTEEVAATMGGKVYRARIIKDPTDPAVVGKVYQIVLIDDPDDPSVKGKVYNAILTGGSEAVVVGPAASPLELPDAIADSLSYVKAFGGTEQRNLPDGYTQLAGIVFDGSSYIDTGLTSFSNDGVYECDFVTSTLITTFLFGQNPSTRSPQVGFFTTSSNLVWQYGTIFRLSTGNSANTAFSIVAENGKLTTNGTTTTGTASASITINQHLFVGAGVMPSASTPDSRMFVGTINRFKYTLAGVVICDLVPVKRNSDNVLGFYDTARNTFLTNAGTGTFAAGGEAVPTPDTPMNIVTNNGVLKARHQSGLPLGYTLLDYIASTGTQAIKTGVKYTGNNFEIEWEAKDNDSSGQSTLFACVGAQPYSGGLYGNYGGRNYYIGTSSVGLGYVSNDSQYHKWKIVVSGQDATLYKDGVQVGTDDFAGTINTTDEIYLFCGGKTSAVNPALTQFSKWDLKSWKFTDNGVVKFNAIPAKDSNNVLGIYDTVSGQFFTNAGTGTFTAGSTVSDPVVAYADGTTETLWVHSKNLFDENWNRNTGVSTQTATWGQVVSAPSWSTSGLIPVKAGQQYTISYNTTVQLYVFYYESDATMQQSYDTTSGTKRTFTVPSGATHIRLQINKSTEAAIEALEAQLETGATVTTYEPYYDGGSAICENLLSVGDYTDVQEILAGDVTRKVGIKVLDGTESWTVASTNVLQADVFPVSSAQPAVGGYCTALSYTNSSTLSGMPENSFRLGSQAYPLRLYVKSSTLATDATTWTNYLKAQYAAGTPVIVVYPLATATAESVAGQTLQVQAGDNIVEITQASLNNLELEAAYIKEAE